MNQQTRSFLTRVAYIYFFLQCVPLDPKYYATIFSLPWSKLRYEDIFAVAHYTPRFFGATPGFADAPSESILSEFRPGAPSGMTTNSTGGGVDSGP